MKYLITGGCGFIGSHLAEALLLRGSGVRLYDNLSTGKKENAPEAADVFEGDIRDASAIENALSECDGVFHLAAIASVARCAAEKDFCHSVNLTGSEVVFRAAAKANVPVVFASSAAVYGDARELPIAEQMPAQPLSFYGEDKLAGEHILETLAENSGLPSMALRFFNVYGPRQSPDSDYSGVISIFMRRLRENLGLTIYGDGEQSRDFIYVGDVASHLVAAMTRLHAQTLPGCTVLNICCGESVSINALAKTLAGILGKDDSVLRAPARTGDIRHSLGDPSKTQNTLGLKASVALEDGLAKTLKEFT